MIHPLDNSMAETSSQNTLGRFASGGAHAQTGAIEVSKLSHEGVTTSSDSESSMSPVAVPDGA